MTMPVFISGMHIADDGTLVIDADEAAEAGVKSIEFIEGTADARIAELEARLAEAEAENAQLSAAFEYRIEIAPDDLLATMLARAEEAEARAEAAIKQAGDAQFAIKQAYSILADMHGDEGCQMQGARGNDVGCLACMAQMALAEGLNVSANPQAALSPAEQDDTSEKGVKG